MNFPELIINVHKKTIPREKKDDEQYVTITHENMKNNSIIIKECNNIHIYIQMNYTKLNV